MAHTIVLNSTVNRRENQVRICMLRVFSFPHNELARTAGLSPDQGIAGILPFPRIYPAVTPLPAVFPFLDQIILAPGNYLYALRPALLHLFYRCRKFRTLAKTLQ